MSPSTEAGYKATIRYLRDENKTLRADLADARAQLGQLKWASQELTTKGKGQLTDRQTQVLEFIRTFKDLNGIPPTHQEIRDHFEFSSCNAAQAHLKALADKGWVRCLPGVARGIQVMA